MSNVNSIFSKGDWFVSVSEGSHCEILSYNFLGQSGVVKSLNAFVSLVDIDGNLGNVACYTSSNTVYILELDSLKVKGEWKVDGDVMDVVFSSDFRLLVYFERSYHIYSLEGKLLRKVKLGGAYLEATNSGCYFSKRERTFYLPVDGKPICIGKIKIVVTTETDSYHVAREFRGDILIFDKNFEIVDRIEFPSSRVIMQLENAGNDCFCAYVYDNEDEDYEKLMHYSIMDRNVSYVDTSHLGANSFSVKMGAYVTEKYELVFTDGSMKTIDMGAIDRIG